MESALDFATALRLASSSVNYLEPLLESTKVLRLESSLGTAMEGSMEFELDMLKDLTSVIVMESSLAPKWEFYLESWMEFHLVWKWGERWASLKEFWKGFQSGMMKG
jgi:hypothetical protein